KLQILHDIVSNLYRIHSKGYLHRDLHPGNILLKENYEAYITDLGLSKPLDEKEQEDRIHGVLPYVAPELFQKNPYTKASDIYSFGIIMVEMTTGQRPFNDHKFDFDLVVMICDFGLRPRFAPGTPDCYVKLANQCMNSDPEKRPSIRKIITKLDKWLEIVKNEKENENENEGENESEDESENKSEDESDNESENESENASEDESENESEDESENESANESEDESEYESENESEYETANESANESEDESENENENGSESRIKKQFLESDEISKNSPIITEKLNNMYTSKPYKISEIGSRLSNLDIISKTASV
ncbi:kinase-like domain-containing protein, partial [Gigaspora rosea]